MVSKKWVASLEKKKERDCNENEEGAKENTIRYFRKYVLIFL